MIIRFLLVFLLSLPCWAVTSVCPVFTLTASSTNWQLNIGGAGAFNGAVIAATPTQSVGIYYLGPGYSVQSVRINVTQAFAASGLSGLTMTIGSAATGTGYYANTAFSLTTIHDTGTLTALNSGDSSNIILALNANQNLNAASFSAGSVDVTICMAGSTAASLVTLNTPATGTVSGKITFTTTVATSILNAVEVDYVFNDFYTIARVQKSQDPAWTFANYNTGWLLDGPGWFKAVAKDISGNILATSAETAVTLNNFGVAVTVNSPTLTTPTINMSGTVNFDWTASVSSVNALNCQCSVDGSEFDNTGQCYQTGGSAVPMDTTTLQNGLHVFSCSATTAGTPRNNQFAFSFVGNVQNGHTLLGVRPDIDNIVMTTGQTYQLAPVLYYTDGTTGAGSFTYTQKNACNLTDSAYVMPFPCASQTPSTPTAAITDANGPNYATVSGTGLITAGSTPGHTIVIITDVSGKVAYVNVAVRATQNVYHFGKDGSLLSAYDPTKSFFRLSLFNVPDYLVGGQMAMSQVGNDTLANHYSRAGFTAFEDGAMFGLTAHGVANIGTYQSSFNSQKLPIIQAFSTAFPKMCYIARGDQTFAPDGTLNNWDQGASASWSPDPLVWLAGAVKSVVNICGFEMRDEADQGYRNFNPTASYQMSNGAIDHIVVLNGTATVYSGSNLSQPLNSWFPGETRWGGNVVVSGAATTGLNGTQAVLHEWCSSWNVYYHGICPQFGNVPYSITGATNANPAVFAFTGGGFTTSSGTIQIVGATGVNWSTINGTQTATFIDSSHFSISGINSTSWGALTGTVGFNAITAQPTATFDMATSAANGTYNLSTDPNLVISVMGDTSTNPVLSGDPAYRNPLFTNIASRLTNAGLSYAWPIVGASDTVSHMTWESAPVSSYRSFYRSNAETGMLQPTFPWGFGFPNQRLAVDFHHWMTLPTSFNTPSVWYHIAQANGYVFSRPEVATSELLPVQLYAFNTGGRSRTIASFSGAVMATTTPHGLNIVKPGPAPYYTALITGNSDSGLNANSGRWKLSGLPIDSTHVEVFASVPGNVGCNLTGSPTATVTIRGKTYSTTGIGVGTFFELPLTTNAPADLISGEHITVSGLTGGNTCGNGTYAFDSFFQPPATNGIVFDAFVNSTGTGGTVQINDGQGLPDPVNDQAVSYTRPIQVQPDAIHTASSGLVGALREYAMQLGNSGILLGYPGETNACTPCQQRSPLPFSSAPLIMQQGWWALAHTNALIARAAPFWLQTIQPSPSLGTPYYYNRESSSQFNEGSRVSCTSQSSTLGKALTCVNTMESTETITVNHALYQTGTNPISIYRIAYPKMNTLLLTGAQSSASYMLDPGESIAFLYHAVTASYVQNIPIGFNLAGVPNATQVAVRYSYSYPGPLKEVPAQVVCSTSPCSLPVDLGLADWWYQLVYLNSTGTPLISTDPTMIPHS